MAFVAAGDITVHYELTGPSDAPVVLFANSIGTNFHIWDEQVKALGGRIRTLRYDMRGHGLTDATPGAYSMNMLADDALCLLDTLGIEQAHVCGLSIGGMMAQRLAVKAPDRILSLVLADTASVIGPPEIWQSRIEAIRAGGMASIAAGVMPRWFTSAFLESETERVRGYVNMVSRTSDAGYIGCAMAIRDADLRGDCARIACPTLVVVGEQDQATPLPQAEELIRAISNSQLKVITGAGHLPCVEQPAAFTDAVFDHLQTVGVVAPKETVRGNRNWHAP
ncbi:3-oxoadipate enol-lactonase [Azospirillum melinis]|uniref:3-oxoadipate enol-lactonase n=1 Tax=Azospirillum melinis TaxID=328839 RepID=A0ABX2KMH3_9PROT|nr:3-oxoadipate enol-lactonase [Azospirillum melinis]MBP2309545.1 3-oxoadipate enol-lactonase [Azospirillum melinis]NUB02681.1 3-oxoadipate enol-lactonase [Azospirillum melinis]